jgi:FtsZ-interacting cell division protein YlmF
MEDTNMGLKSFLGLNGEEEVVQTEGEDSFYSVSKEEAATTPDLGSNKMILFEPRAYSESTQITDYLKKRNTVVVNLKRVTPDQAKRIVDFLYGTIYAIGGELQKLGGGIFLCTPNNVNVEGNISGEEKAKSKKVEKEEDDFDF